MKIFRKFRPSSWEFIKSYTYKNKFLEEITSVDKLKGSNLNEKFQRLLAQKKYNKIILISSEIKKMNSLPEVMKTVIESAKHIYNARESNPLTISKRFYQINRFEKDRTQLILIGGLLLLSLYLVYNIDVFFYTNTKKLKGETYNQTSPHENWFQRLRERISGEEKSKNEEFILKHNLEERLKDVKGINEVKDEIEEVIKILKNPTKYEDAGAKLMKGILLVGKPGTGKTLLARALAGESGVNFIYTSASEFDQKYVGAGSAKLRKLFKKARENSPCIIFIDEIDSLIDKGRRKGSNSSSEDRAGVNTFLAEMDGFKKNEHVFILGATNSIDSLDEAALRPGRFDKVIHVPLPDKTGRNEIFSFYLNKIKLPITADITALRLSEMTPGFSGAEIENMVNTATILAVDRQIKFLDKSTFEEARDRIIMGIKLKSNKNIRYILQRAVHEAGHALVCYKSPICKKELHKVSIAKRGLNEGKTSILPDENFSGTKDEFITYIGVSLAGIFAEEIYFGENKVSTGCGNDLSRASSFAKDMVMKYAMNSADFGYMYINEGQTVDHKISIETRNKIDNAADNIIKKASAHVKEVLNSNVEELKMITQHLLDYEELDRDELDKILNNGGSVDDKEKKKKVRNVNIGTISL